MGSAVLCICNASCVLYYTGSGEKYVHVVLSAPRMRLCVCVYGYISCRYD